MLLLGKGYQTQALQTLAAVAESEGGVPVTKTQNPIEALEMAAVALHEGLISTPERQYRPDDTFRNCRHNLCADARKALGQVEAVVRALGWRPCEGEKGLGDAEDCLASALPIRLWCWRCTAHAPFAKEGS